MRFFNDKGVEVVTVDNFMQILMDKGHTVSRVAIIKAIKEDRLNGFQESREWRVLLDDLSNNYVPKGNRL